jgi:asparagine synthase (glutamine-hydrolysing)
MSGIAGFYNTAVSQLQDEAETILRRMTDSIRHRGPDDAGIWYDTRNGVGLGFRRLAVRDFSASGHQPMASADNRYVIVFDGRVYNYASLREELLGLGHIFQGRSDTEVLLAGIRQWGLQAAVRRFSGMFAFALWDAESRSLHLGRDRMGVKPLYYGWLGKSLVFGSELKALRAHPGFQMKIERGALALFLRYGYIPTPFTIYENIYKLTPGQILTIWPGSVVGDERREVYWSPRAAVEKGLTNPFRGNERDALDALDELLTRSIGLRRMADVPVGVLLSGHTASATLAALLQREDGQPLQTFYARFEEEDKGEHVRAIASRLGAEYTETVITSDDALAVLPRLPGLYDEPFADLSQIQAALVSELARRRVIVGLSGEGGDVLFGGCLRYSQAMRAWSAAGWMPDSWRRAAARGLGHFSGQDGALGQLLKVFNAPAREALYLDLVSGWKQPAAALIDSREPLTIMTDPLRWMNVSTFAERMMSLDLVTSLPDGILTKVDRAGMGASLEIRLPFVDDHEVVEFAWSLPLRMKIRDGQGNWILRRLLARYAPRLRFARPGMASSAPIGAWLCGALRAWAEDLLSDERLEREGFLQPGAIRQAWEEHLSGRRNRQQELWSVLMFQAWLAEK